MTEADDLLLALDAADQAHRPGRERFMVASGMGPLPGVPVQHPGLDEGFRCAEQDIETLEDSGYLRVERARRGSFFFDVTDAGHKHAEKLRLAGASPGSTSTTASGGVLDWDSSVLPVLQAVARAYEQSPNALGVRAQAVVDTLGADADSSQVGLILADLARAGFIEETLGSDQQIGPGWCRLQEKGLQVTSGWPTTSGETALERLIALVDQRIDRASSEEERSNWQRFREGITGVGRDVLVGLLTNAATAAARGYVG